MTLVWRSKRKSLIPIALPGALALQIIACSPPGEGYRSQPIPEGETTFVTTEYGPVSVDENQSGTPPEAPPKVEPKTEKASSAPQTPETSVGAEDAPPQKSAPAIQQVIAEVRTGAPTSEQQSRSENAQNAAVTPVTQAPPDPNRSATNSPTTPLLRNQNPEELQAADSAVSTRGPADPKDLVFRQELARAESALDKALKKLQTRIELANKGEAKTQRQREAAEEREQAIKRHQNILDSEIAPFRLQAQERARALESTTQHQGAEVQTLVESKAEEQQRILDTMSLLIKRVGEIEASLAKDIASINIDLIMDEQSRNNGID